MLSMSCTEIIKLLQTQFAINPIKIKMLWGYDNSNYLIKTKDKKFVFKTYLNTPDTFSFVEAESETLLFLHGTNENAQQVTESIYKILKRHYKTK